MTRKTMNTTEDRIIGVEGLTSRPNGKLKQMIQTKAIIPRILPGVIIEHMYGDDTALGSDPK